MKEKLTRVYTCVCPSATNDENISFEESIDLIFNGFLYADGIGLALPTAIICAFVGDVKEVAQVTMS